MHFSAWEQYSGLDQAGYQLLNRESCSIRLALRGKRAKQMEDNGKNRVTISIMGEEYILRGSSSTDEMHRIGSYVDHLMRTLAEKNIQMSKHKIAVLAALNLADELFKIKENINADVDTEEGRESDHELA